MSQVETASDASNPLDASIRAVLGSVRSQIRLYILVQGLAALAIWVTLTFWMSFAIDYLPVLVGASEMPSWARGIGLGVAAIGAAYVVYRYLASRLFVPLADRSMALVLERKYRQFHDSLVTTVELSGRAQTLPQVEREMLNETRRSAIGDISKVSVRDVFNMRPLVQQVALALFGILSISVAYGSNPAAIGKAARRIYLLDNELWERYARIEVVGLQVRRPLEGVTTAEPQQVAFQDDAVKVAKGANLTLQVRADASAAVVPTDCEMRYRTAEGDYGSVTVKRLGQPRDGFQQYICDAKPLAGILSSLEFDIVGYDHRLRGYRIDVVDSPTVVATTMDVRFPDYMVDEKNATRLPREGEPVLSSGNQLPVGTHVLLHIGSSKPLAKAHLRVMDPEATDPGLSLIAEHDLEFASSPETTKFSFDLGALAGGRTLEVSLLDTDGVTNERPHRMFFSTIADEAPRWELALSGIGTQITPDVNIPFLGKVTDDYGVQRVWLEALRGDEEPINFDVQLARGSELNAAIDVRQERTDRQRLDLKPGEKISVVAHATDRFNLGSTANVGSSERYVLEVVTADQLLVGLDARELAFRRRFEVIVDELSQMRDSLLRVKPGQTSPAAADPLDETEPAEKKLSPEELARREVELRLLRVQRAIAQTRKSAQEVTGVAQGFDGIRAELENNRVDTEDRKSRLKEQIADPLHALVAGRFASVEARLASLEDVLEDATKGPPAAEVAVTESNLLLAELDAVLQKMLKLESYNEIVDLVRDLLKEQGGVQDDTKREQRRELEE